MNELEIKKLWQSSNEKLEKSLNINRINSDEIAQLKVFHFISSMKPIKIFALLVGIVWVGLGVIVLGNLFMYAFKDVSKFFLFSASIQVGLTAIAVWIYLYQLIMIYQIDITEPIVKTQEKLASLKKSTLWVTRILFLQLPVWTTFYWNKSMLENGNWFLWIIQVIITLSFAYLAGWLFFNIKFENRNKKWFQWIFRGKEWIPLMKSIELLKEIEGYKIEKKSII